APTIAIPSTQDLARASAAMADQWVAELETAPTTAQPPSGRAPGGTLLRPPDPPPAGGPLGRAPTGSVPSLGRALTGSVPSLGRPPTGPLPSLGRPPTGPLPIGG